MKNPLGVYLISAFYLFGAAVLLLTVIWFQPEANPIGINERFGMPWMPERLMRVIVAVFTLVMIYGFFMLTRWGYWMMISYSLAFGTISSILATRHPDPVFFYNMTESVIILIYTFKKRQVFLGKA